MRYDSFQAIEVAVDSGVAWSMMNHLPINLLDRILIEDLDQFARQVGTDPEIKVVVVDSADPEFFAAHGDVALILANPNRNPDRGDRPGRFQALVDRFRTMPKATIAVIEGAARGGGSELALAFDMRFAAAGKARLSQPEVALGIIPGGGGTQRLPRLLGRARALEVILGGDDLDAATAEQWGYVNRALPPDQLRPFVRRLAMRIASYPPDAVAAAKQAVDASLLDPGEGLIHEDFLCRTRIADPTARARMQAFLDRGGQTRDIEREELPLDLT